MPDRRKPLNADPLGGRSWGTRLLETIAEVSVAFAGFAGIVSVFSQSTIDPGVRLWRIRLMIVTSLITLFLSLLPSALGESGLSGDNIWRPASFFLAAATATQLSLTYRWMPTSYRDRIFAQNRMAVLLTTSSVVFASAELAAACGLLPIATSAAYSWGLLYFLFLSSYHFFRLILAVQPD